jgi:hypothetical protein
MPVSIQSNTRIGHILTRKPSLAAMTMRLKISIVVPAFNEEKRAKHSRCVEDIFAGRLGT